MNKKIFQALFFAALVTMVLAAAVSVTVFYFSYSDRVQGELFNELRYIGRIYDMYPESALEVSPEQRLTIIAQDGSVLYDTDADSDQMENHLARPEIQEAMRYGRGSDRRFSNTLLESYFYVASRASDGTVLRLSVSVDNIFSFVMSMLLPLSVLLLLLLLVLAFAATRIARAITEPINRIDLEHPETAESYEELSPLLYRIAKQQNLIRRQIEEAESKNREFRVIIDNMSEGLAVIDQNARVLSINRAAWFLFDAAEVREGDSILAICRSESFSVSIDKALKGQRDEFVFSTATRVLQIIASPVINGDNKATGAAVIIIDITEKSEREKLRREFTANVSHELKTPLQAISGYAEFLRNGGIDESHARDFGNEIYTEAQRLIALVHDIIKLSKLDEGDGEEMADEPLLPIAEDVVRRLGKKAANAGVALSVSGEDLSVFGSASLLDEMIFNLVDNAILYNRRGGKAEIRIFREGENTVLSVKDTGIGIPDSDKDRVFERFYRVDKSRNKTTGGTGLGLSIVRHGAIFHNASIELESKLGEGTEVRIIFPDIK